VIVKSIRPEVLTATRTAYWLAIDDAPEEQLVFIDKSSGIRVVERDRLAARVGRGTAATIARAVIDLHEGNAVSVPMVVGQD